MRLSEDRIKEAILDTDPEIRQRAVRYFAKSFSSDTSVVPLVIEAVETFGREDAYHLIGLSSDLPQTEDTIDWIIGELNDSQSDQYENYTYNLSRVLIKADATLLLPNESAILDSLHFLDGLHAPLTERLQMLSWDETDCWRELETLCEEGKDKRYINEFNLDYGRRIVEALSRYGDECEDRVHELLRQQQFPGRWNSGGKRAILRIVFVNEDLLVGRRFWRPGRIGVAVWAKFGDRGGPGRTGQDR